MWGNKDDFFNEDILLIRLLRDNKHNNVYISCILKDTYVTNTLNLSIIYFTETLHKVPKKLKKMGGGNLSKSKK